MQSAAIHELDAIKASILGESPFGEVRIRDVRMREQAGFEGDEDYVHLVVYADDPPAGRDTWDVFDVIKLRQRVLQLATKSDVDLPRIVVDVYPREDDVQSDATEGVRAAGS